LTGCEGAGRRALIKDGVEALTLVISKGCGAAILKPRGCRDRCQEAGECGSDNALEQVVKMTICALASIAVALDKARAADDFKREVQINLGSLYGSVKPAFYHRLL
tara:strand:+ start:111 stop:428 length:318 start_codon:yes stop_codon:yes gene_type:complete